GQRAGLLVTNHHSPFTNHLFICFIAGTSRWASAAEINTTSQETRGSGISGSLFAVILFSGHTFYVFLLIVPLSVEGLMNTLYAFYSLCHASF
ncbi:MAG TPA: hypothetical protein VE912_08165, partial [Bacteroidales bacterium]|nr:hypothetical protein [Bacteroidales bacterium]